MNILYVPTLRRKTINVYRKKIKTKPQASLFCSKSKMKIFENARNGVSY